MSHSFPDQTSSEDQSGVPDNQEASSSGIDSVTLAKDAFQGRFESLSKMPEETQVERLEKIEKVNRLSGEMRKKRNEFADEGRGEKNLENLNALLGLVRKKGVELEKIFEAEKKRLKAVETVIGTIERSIDRALSNRDKPTRKAALSDVLEKIEKTPEQLKEKAKMLIRNDELSNSKKKVEENLNAIKLEELQSEFERLDQQLDDGESAKNIKKMLDELIKKIKETPRSEQLLKVVQQTHEKVEKMILEQVKQNQQVAKDVRRVGAGVRLLFREASNAKGDKKERERNIVEAIHLLQNEVFDDELNPNNEKIAALRYQFEGVQDEAYRTILLNWVLKNPGVEITVENLDLVMKNLPENVEEESATTPEEKNANFIEQRKKILQMEDDPGRRFHRLTELLQKIRNTNARDRDFADHYGDILLMEIGDEWRKCKIILQNSINELRENDHPDDSKAVIQRFRKADDPESLNLEDTSVIAQLVEGTFTHESESNAPDMNESIEIFDDHTVELRTEVESEPEPEKKDITRKAGWVSAAVLAVLAGVWYSRDSKEPSVSGGDVIPVVSSMPLTNLEPEVKGPTPSELAEQALRILEERRLNYERELSEVSQLGTREQKISRLKELLAALALDPDRESFAGLQDRLTRILQQYEEEERSELLRARKVQFEQRLTAAQTLKNDADKKAALEILAAELSSEPSPGFPDLQNLIADELQQIEKLLLRAERKAEFERRLSEIGTLTSDEVKRERIIVLESDLNPQPPQTEPEFPELLERAREIKKETEQRLEMAAQRYQFAQKLEQASSLETDEAKKAALEELISELRNSPENDDLLKRAEEELRVVEERLSTPPVVIEPPKVEPETPAVVPEEPTVPERQVPPEPSVADELRQERLSITARITSISGHISRVETEIQQWKNHLVIEDAVRRRSVLQEKGLELSRLQSELQAYQQRDEMLARVLSLETKNQQLDRMIELERHILPVREGELGQIQTQVRRLENIRVRTPGENTALRQQKELESRHLALVQLLREEVRLLGKRATQADEGK
jgi:hypothetical protein